MEVTGGVPELSRRIVPNSLSEWGITAKGSAPGKHTTVCPLYPSHSSMLNL
jgi:hypothetical protein